MPPSHAAHVLWLALLHVAPAAQAEPSLAPDAGASTLDALEAEATTGVLDSSASVLVLDAKAASETDGAVARLITEALAHTLQQERRDTRVSSGGDLRALVQAQALRDLAGCEDEDCVVRLGPSVQTDYVLSTRVGTLDVRQLVYVSLVDTRAGTVRARASGSWAVRGATLAKEVGAVVRHLLADGAPPEEEAAPLSEQRIAVAFEELDERGNRLPVRLLEPCLTKLLLEANARLVSQDQVARLRRQLDLRALVAGTPLDALATDVADLLLTGVVQYAAGPQLMGFSSQSADANLQLLQLDTGEVIVAESGTGRGPGGVAQAAMRTAATRACEDLKPRLVAALGRNRERGRRIVLELQGAFAPDRPVALASALAKLPRVRTARVRKVGPQGSVVDVVVTGGDGIRVALEIQRARLPVRVVEAGPSLLRVVP